MKRIPVLLTVLCAGMLFICSRAGAAESSYNCSVSQGFNFQKTEKDIVGHINYLKIGDTEVQADLAVTNPESTSSAAKKVVCVASGIMWKGGYSDPVMFACQVSTANKNKLSTLVHKTMSNTSIQFDFTIYDYDYKQKKYFKAFHSNGVKLQGLVQKQGGDFMMTIASEQSNEVESPKNYDFSLGVVPSDMSQEIHLAVSATDKFAKQWGVAVGQ